SARQDRLLSRCLTQVRMRHRAESRNTESLTTTVACEARRRGRHAARGMVFRSALRPQHEALRDALVPRCFERPSHAAVRAEKLAPHRQLDFVAMDLALKPHHWYPS